jgi:hypothetical protein
MQHLYRLPGKKEKSKKLRIGPKNRRKIAFLSNLCLELPKWKSGDV